MKTYFSGTDQYKLIYPKKRANTFCVSDSEYVFDDCIVDWDLVLYSQSVNGVKTWFCRGTITDSVSIKIYPFLDANIVNSGSSKCVPCGEVVYILDEVTSILYSLNIPRFYEKYKARSFETLSNLVEKVVFETPTVPQIVDISSSGKQCLAIDSNGGIYTVPNLLCRLEGHNWKHVYSGFAFHSVLSDTGAVYSWGNGSRGELGHRNIKIACEYPQRIDFFDDLPSIVNSLACGGWHTLALTSDGDIYSWGWNESGQLGHTSEKLSAINTDPYPIDLGSAEDPVVGIAAGARHSVAMLKSGSIYTWGSNNFGQLGQGDLLNRSVPTTASLAEDSQSKPKHLICGRWSSIVLCE